MKKLDGVEFRLIQLLMVVKHALEEQEKGKDCSETLLLMTKQCSETLLLMTKQIVETIQFIKE
jgi:hypothetical protein